MTRRRLLMWSSPAVVLVLLVAAKLLLTGWFVHEGRGDFRAKDYRAAQAQFAHLGVLNLYQVWIAEFDRGDADYALQNYSSAQIRFTAALRDAPADRQCMVRRNLALSGRQLGDAALRNKNLAGATAQYTRALRDAGTCRSLASLRAELRKILDALKHRSGSSSKQSSKSNQKADPEPGDKQGSLEQRNRQAAKTQQQNDQSDRQPPPINDNGKGW